jgi:DNA-binding MarR family transcriptional regulator
LTGGGNGIILLTVSSLKLFYSSNGVNPMQREDNPEISRLIQVLKEFNKLLSISGGHNSLSLLYESELTIPQILTLHYVFHCGKVSISSISETLRLSLGATSHLVDKLVKRGYLLREENPKDRRIKYVSITESGAEFIERLNESRTYDLANALSFLEMEDIRKLTDLIGEVNEKLKNKLKNEGKDLCKE